MKIDSTIIKGAYVLTRDISIDGRGYFCRLSDSEELKRAGISADFVQISLSCNHKTGTLRGLHSQSGDSAEDKLVAVLSGKIFDVCVDVRENSPTFGRYVSEVLSEENGKAMYIPKGCAHGFVTLSDDARIAYLMTEYYNPKSEKGYRWNDKTFDIQWPIEPIVISDKDLCWELMGGDL